MKRDTRSAYRARAKATEDMIDAAIEEQRAESDRQWRESREESRSREAERHKFTRDEITGARFVRTRFGWHQVAKVNKTTVSVKTEYSWLDRYAFDKILEVRHD